MKITAGVSCRRERDKAFTLALNQDSFPEIDETIVRDYLRQIRRTTTTTQATVSAPSRAPARRAAVTESPVTR